MRLTMKRPLAKPLRFLSDLWHSGHAWVVMWFGVYLVGEGHHGYGVLLLALVIPLAMLDGLRRRNVAELVRVARKLTKGAISEPLPSKRSRVNGWDLCDLASQAIKVDRAAYFAKEDGEDR